MALLLQTSLTAITDRSSMTQWLEFLIESRLGAIRFVSVASNRNGFRELTNHAPNFLLPDWWLKPATWVWSCVTSRCDVFAATAAIYGVVTYFARSFFEESSVDQTEILSESFLKWILWMNFVTGNTATSALFGRNNDFTFLFFLFIAVNCVYTWRHNAGKSVVFMATIPSTLFVGNMKRCSFFLPLHVQILNWVFHIVLSWVEQLLRHSMCCVKICFLADEQSSIHKISNRLDLECFDTLLSTDRILNYPMQNAHTNRITALGFCLQGHL